MNYQEIIDDQLERINRDAKQNRKRIRLLSPEFDYAHYNYGEARIEGICENFEEYLEQSAKLPTNNELHSYDLNWYESRNDTVVIKHSVPVPNNGYRGEIVYCFIVKDPARTLDLLTEGKCTIVERKTPAQKPTTYTALSCEDA